MFVDGKPIMYKAWLKKGIIHIKDSINEDSNFLSLTDLKAKFNLEVPFTVYYGLLNAIPASWNENIQNMDVAPLEVVPSLLLPSTKIAYSTILGKSYSVPTAESKILNYGLTTDNIQKVYLFPSQILKEPKLIIFQFKIIHNILPTQSSLFRAGIRGSDICPPPPPYVILPESQSLSHMLITCHISSLFWNQFKHWWRKNFQEQKIYPKA